jgi:hypothetical protein
MNSYIHTYIYSHIYGSLETIRSLWLTQKIWIKLNNSNNNKIIYIIFYVLYIFNTPYIYVENYKIKFYGKKKDILSFIAIHVVVILICCYDLCFRHDEEGHY